MNLIRYDDPQTFYDRAAPFLLQEEARYNLMLALVAGLINGRTYDGPPYMTVIEDDSHEIVLVSLRTPPHKVLLAGEGNPDAFKLLADDVRTTYDFVPGAQGSKALVSTFAEAWSTTTGQRHEKSMEQRIYQLETVTYPANPPAGALRRATADDYDLLLEWVIAFNDEAMGVTDRKRAEEAMNAYLFGSPEGRFLSIWEDDERPVSMAGLSGITPNGGRVSMVYTPPEHRGKGYASACVAALSQQLLDDGYQFCFLYTDLSNPTSNSIYQKIGYRPVGDFSVYSFQ